MKFGIVTFPGSNCDYDTYHAVVDALGEEATYLWHKEHDLRGSDVVILPGGFSYGDYLRAGAIARFSPIMQEVAAHAERGAPVLAICNGFQIACEAGMLYYATRAFGLSVKPSVCVSRMLTPNSRIGTIGANWSPYPSRTVTVATPPTTRRWLESKGRVESSFVTWADPATRTSGGVRMDR